jgi:sporulation protein YlmC with PRC-barrel domain
VFIHPDIGTVEGFFVRSSTFLGGEELFLASQDISHWGTRIRLRHADTLAPVEERVRLRTLLEEGRTVLGQRIITESGRVLGTCRDVQFETKSFRVEWLFSKRFFRWGTPLPITSVIEVRKDAIIVRDLTLPAEVEKVPSVLTVIEELREASASPPSARETQG